MPSLQEGWKGGVYVKDLHHFTRQATGATSVRFPRVESRGIPLLWTRPPSHPSLCLSESLCCSYRHTTVTLVQGQGIQATCDLSQGSYSPVSLDFSYRGLS